MSWISQIRTLPPSKALDHLAGALSESCHSLQLPHTEFDEEMNREHSVDPGFCTMQASTSGLAIFFLLVFCFSSFRV